MEAIKKANSVKRIEFDLFSEIRKANWHIAHMEGARTYVHKRQRIKSNIQTQTQQP